MLSRVWKRHAPRSPSPVSSLDITGGGGGYKVALPSFIFTAVGSNGCGGNGQVPYVLFYSVDSR